MKRSEFVFNVLLVPVDFIMLLVAGLTTYLLRTELLSAFRPVQFELTLPLSRFFVLVVFVSLFFLAAYAASGLYAMRVQRTAGEEFLKIIVASSAGIMGVIIFIFLRQELFDSRFLVLGAWLFAILFVTLGRMGMKFIQRRFQFGEERVLIIGDDPVSHTIADAISALSFTGYRIVKQLSHPDIEEVRSSVGNPGVDEVILADPNYPSDKISELVHLCNESHLTFRYVPNMHQTLTRNFSFDTFSGVPLIELRRTALDGWGRVAKRMLDIIASFIGLVLFSPLCAAAAFAVKWESEGPVFVRLQRVSKNRIFNLYKFRSMIHNAEKYKAHLAGYNERGDSPLFKMKNDPRVTKVGRFLRRTRIDELPQLWNVLKGDMSLVGPRPHQPDEIARYERRHKKVLAIPAGATGLAQVSGSSDLPFEEEVKLDTFYIENWSLLMDIKIIIKTAVKMFRDRSAV